VAHRLLLLLLPCCHWQLAAKPGSYMALQTQQHYQQQHPQTAAAAIPLLHLQLQV
jgi:hypothetical protein